MSTSTIGMRDCVWPIGYCPQPAYCDQPACVYHTKMLLGLFAPTRHASWAINPADILSDEQLELVGVLEALFVGPATIANALTRRVTG